MKTTFAENEKLIITALIVTIVGLINILLASSMITVLNVLIPSLATLAAAFFGAWFAYKLQDKAKRREELKQHVDKANDLLFALFQKLNALKIFQWDFVEPCRSDPGKMISLRPALNFKLPESPMRPENITFLLKTRHKQLLFDAHIEEQRFAEAEKAIRFRSSLHLNYVQPVLHSAGMIEGAQYTDIQFKAALGELLYTQLERATEAVIYHVDRTVESSDQLREKLIKALKETFPDEPILDFVLLEESPNKALKRDAA